MNKLKELRELKGKTQIELTKEANIKRSNYSRYENGTGEPNIETLIKLANYFNTSVDYIIGHESEIIELNSYPDYKKDLIKLVLKLTQLECEKLSARAEAMLEMREIYSTMHNERSN